MNSGPNNDGFEWMGVAALSTISGFITASIIIVLVTLGYDVPAGILLTCAWSWIVMTATFFCIATKGRGRMA